MARNEMESMNLENAAKRLNSLISEFETSGVKYEVLPCEASDDMEILIEDKYFMTIGNWNFDIWTLCCYAHSIAAACNLIARRKAANVELIKEMMNKKWGDHNEGEANI